MKKRVTLCADDYALTPAISQGILSLIERGRLQAVSCMVNTPYWQEHALSLRPYIGKIDIGLHFAVTDVQPSVSPLYRHPHLIAQAYLRCLPRRTIGQEWQAQFEQFREAMGVLPDFIDGHQHVHQLPIIREAMLSAYKKQYANHLAYVRVPLMPLTRLTSAWFKSWVIRMTGAATLKKVLERCDIPHNTSCSGAYDFKQAQRYPQFFRCFLNHIQSGGLIVCHPGLAPSSRVSETEQDTIADSRPHEFEYLSSDQFIEDCQYRDVTLSSFF